MERIKSLEMVSKAVNKKGKLKGKNKKETRGLKAICPHNRYNKKGKMRPTIVNNNDGTCTCALCGATFSTKIYKGDMLKDAIQPFKALNDQAKYMAAASGAGAKAIDYFAQTGAMLANYPNEIGRAHV